jgi:hypothetical protein
MAVGAISGCVIMCSGTPVLAAPPAVATDGAQATGATTASVEGNADAEGQSTTLHADYALATEQWCTSGGAAGTPAETTPQNLGSGYAMLSEITITLEGLMPGSAYCAELVATNASGTSHGGQIRFSTPALAAPPAVATDGTLHIATSPVATPFVAIARPLSRADRLKRALKLCSHKPRRQKANCVRSARRKYGKPAKAPHRLETK